jgi:hypothetical protein
MVRGNIVRSILIVLPFFTGCAVVQAPTHDPPAESSFLQRVRQVLSRVPPTLAKNHKTFAVPDGVVFGFGAGDAYPQIWLRDSSWIVDAASAYYPVETLTSWLDLHLASAERNGRLRDWVASGSAAAFREWAPRAQDKAGIAFDTNSNESDQEPSAALAWCRVEALMGAEAVAGPARDARITRLIKAMDALVRDRTDPKTGLIWSGLTADWGDVSPSYPDQQAIYLDAKTPRTLSLYSNVMAFAALDCLASLEGPKVRREALATRAARLKDRIRSGFWMRDRGFFRIRLDLDPLPKGFSDDGDRFALGGNALAALFGVADDAEADSIFAAAERLRTANLFSTISTTLIPPYPRGAFQHPAVREPFQYQNGGQWDWFGAALVQAEFERGRSEQARAHLDQIATRILKAGPGLHEWYAQDGSPKGSAAYAASAAALHNAVVKGLLGITRSPGGYRVVVRTGETLLPFEVKSRAAGTVLSVTQAVGPTAIDVQVGGGAPLREICSVLPTGRGPAEPSPGIAGSPQSLHRMGSDTIICADVASQPSPVRVRFALGPR